MADRYVSSLTATREHAGNHPDQWDQEVMQALVTAGALVALSDGRVETVERDEVVRFIDRQGFAPTVAPQEMAEAFGHRVQQLLMVKWPAGDHFSHPHFHPHDRFITVLKGTWSLGTGTKFDPDATVPMPAGTFVTHYGQ
jgi:hypothetical protein